MRRSILALAVLAAMVGAPVLAATPPSAAPAPGAEQVRQLQRALYLQKHLADGYAESVRADQDTIAQLRADIAILEEQLKALQQPSADPPPAPKK